MSSFHARITAVLGSVLLGGTLLATAPAASAAAPNSPWPQTDGNGAHSRINTTERVLSPTAVKKLRLQRTVAPGSTDDDCYSALDAPVLTGGYLYLVRGQKLTKLNPATGATVWATPLTASYTGGVQVAVTGNRAIVASSDCHSESDPNRITAAFDTASGKQVWSARDDGVGTVTVSGGYVVSFANSAGGGSDVTVFDAATGTLAWSFRECSIVTSPVVVRGLVIISACATDADPSPSNITAYRLATGAKVWTRSGSWKDLRGDLETADGRHLYATDSLTQRVQDLNPATGATRYTLSGANSVLAVGPSRVFATCATSTAVCAYNNYNGSPLWTSRGTGNVRLAAGADGVVYLDSGVLLRSTTGARTGTLPGGAGFSPISALSVGDGRIAALDYVQSTADFAVVRLLVIGL